MHTFPTLDAARQAKLTLEAAKNASHVVEIDHATAGRCFICVRCPMKILANALRSKPMPEIVRLVAEHSIRTPAYEAAEAARMDAETRANARCERCGVHVDIDTCYQQTERARFGASVVRVKAYYCDPCRHLLGAIGAGERTELEERAGHVPSPERSHPEDH